MVNTPHPANTGKQEENASGELVVEQTTKKSVAQILFNPSDPKYKKTEDLPRAFRDDFINTEDETGFVRKDADKHFMEAQRQADKNIRHGKTEGYNVMDLLYNSMLNEEEILANIIRSGSFNGIKEEREVSLNYRGHSSGNGVIKLAQEIRKENVDITNELYEKKALTRNFFMELVEAGVTFQNIGKTLPLELRNDKEFLLKLAEKSKDTYIWRDAISQQILLEEGNDFLFKLIEAGGNIYSDNDEIINKYFSDKDHLFVIDYLSKNNTKKSHNLRMIYGAIIEKFKDNRSIKDMLEIILRLYPGIIHETRFGTSYELRSMADEILKKMQSGSADEIVRDVEEK